MTVHYLISTHGAVSNASRLAATLRRLSPEAAVTVQYDRKGPGPDAAPLADQGVTVEPTTRPISWGDLSLTLEFTDWLRRTELADGDWAVHLTGADYVLPGFHRFEKQMLAGSSDMFLEQSILTNPMGPALMSRYRAQTVASPAFLGATAGGGRVARRAVGRILRVVPGMRLREQPRGLPPRVEVTRTPPFADRLTISMGSEWCALSVKAVRALLREQDEHPEVQRWFERTHLAAEGFTHTVLLSRPDLVNDAAPLHFLDFEGAHPRWLTEADLPAMEASSAPFARKFHPDEPALDRLDELLGAF